MNFAKACQEAARHRDACTRHVCATIKMGDNAHPPSIDREGFTVSDWSDGTVVRTFCNGREINGLSWPQERKPKPRGSQGLRDLQQVFRPTKGAP